MLFVKCQGTFCIFGEAMDDTLFLNNVLGRLREQDLYRSLRAVEGAQQAHIIFEGQKVINFCSNNYLGLADDPRLLQAAHQALDSEGLGAGASRLICGNMTSHRKLEERLAAFKRTEKALVFSTGYMANVGIISALCDREDIILSDKLNHASIVDGIILSRAEFKRYPHKDMAALEGMLAASQGCRKRLIVTDSVFSMDGDVAPLKEIVTLAKEYAAMVMVDEAHGFGILGAHGRGLAEELGVEVDIDVCMGTLSKAAGSFGAYACGSKSFIDVLVNKARSFIYTTAMPPAIAAASVQAIDIIEKEPQRRRQLCAHAQIMRQGLKDLGFDVMGSITPIIPVLLKESALVVKFAQRLLVYGILAQGIRPPTVPEDTARLRVTVMATHTPEDITCALKAFQAVKKELCLSL